jgi:PAS domain S-box-containing protein
MALNPDRAKARFIRVGTSLPPARRRYVAGSPLWQVVELDTAPKELAVNRGESRRIMIPAEGLPRSPRTGFLWLGFIAGFITVAAVTWATYNESIRYEYWSNWISHTQLVLNTIDEARADSFRAAVVGESYFQTGDRNEQLQFAAIVLKLQQLSAELRTLTRDNPDQQARVVQFDPLVNRISALLNAVSPGAGVAERGDLIQSSGRAEYVAVFLQLRELLQQMSSEENRLLMARLANARQAAGKSVAITTIGGTFILIWLLLLSGYATSTSKHLTKTARDLTESREELMRAAIEREVRKVDERYRRLVENARDYAIFMLDPEGRVVSWNQGAERLKGYTMNEIVGCDFSRFYTPEDIASGKPARQLAEARKAGMSEDEGWKLRKDGSRFWASSIITAIYTSTGEIQGFGKITRDITERKLAEEKFRGLLESAPDALVIAGKEGRIELINVQTEALFGYRREELLGQPIEVLVPDRFRARHPGHRDGYFGSPKPRPMGAGLDLAALRKDGTEFAAEISLSPIPTPAGTLVTAAIRDVSVRKRLEQEQYRRINEANRLKSEFLANMSHELRTPLNAIIGFASLIREEKVGSLSADQKEYLGDILASSRHLLHLINDILDLAKIEAGKMEFRSEPVELATTIREVTDTLRGLANEKRIRIITELSTAVSIVYLDPAKLKQVLYNYLSNAIKFTPASGMVTVRTQPQANDTFRLEVEDTGIGIAAKDMVRLFVEFQQLDGSATKKYEGTGLGLSLTKRIVEAQGGTVSVQSEPGKGSIFAAVLPRMVPSPQESPSPLPVPPNTGSMTILVIEDDRADREWLIRTLSNAGYRVEPATSGAEAVKLCSQKRFAAITLDLLLPDASGWDVLREIRSTPLNQKVPAIAVTVSRDQGLSSAFLLHDYLVKPVQEGVLLQSLEQAGVHCGNGAVLVVDDDTASLKLISANLNQLGYRPVCMQSAEQALELVRKDPPAVIVLELLSARMNSFQFLDELRKTPAGERIPVIVWTAKALSEDERRRLRSSVQTIMQRNGGTDLLEQLSRYLTGAKATPATITAGEDA